MKNIYRDVLKQAWDITSKNKILWFLGLFAALLGNGGEYQILINIADKIGNGANNLSSKISFNFSFIFSNVYKFLTYNPLEFALMLACVFAFLFLTGFFIWMVMVSQCALIDGVNKICGKKKIVFSEGMNIGMQKFVTILGINIMAKILIFSILFGAGIPLLFKTAEINGLVAIFSYLVFFVFLIPLAIIISFIAKYAIAFAVLKNKNFLYSIKGAFNLFRDNWVVSLEMALILFLLNIAVGILAVFIVALIYIPLSAVSFMYFLSGFMAGSWFIIFLIAVLTISIVGFIGSLLAVFQWASWIILFKKLTSRETVLSKIERSVIGFPQWVREHI
ncbi:MAG: hypothetical protein V1891_01880 [bacterium]